MTLCVAWLVVLGSVAAFSVPARGAEPLVVSTWDGSWKDALHKAVGQRFTKETGVPVKYVVGGTNKRLSRARFNKGRPLVDIALTETHVGRHYISGGLFEKLDLSRIPNAKQLVKQGIRSPYHLGLWSYVYTIAYLPDQVPFKITKWEDLWDPRLKNKIAIPDFDPSHIITVSALLSGGDELKWKKGTDRLLKLKPNIAAFFKTDRQSQDLLRSGEAPVQVMLSVYAYRVGEKRIKVKTVNPTDFGSIVGIDTVSIVAGSKRLRAAYRFINIALSKEAQEDLVRILRVGPINKNVALPPDLKGQPGIFSTQEEWDKLAYVPNDEQRAKALPAWKKWFKANMAK
jgi:putative spermidine/putrescine transport system substrate-binding protein